jgi:hypothetical protein
VLTRARLRVLRSEIALNQAITRATQEHTARLVQIVVDLERSTLRLNMNDVIRAVPSLSPPQLRRQHGAVMERRPLQDITNTVHARDLAINNQPNENQVNFPFSVYEDEEE